MKLLLFKTNRPPIKPLKSAKFMERAQLDLIDMTNQPYRGFNYIAHFIDYFLKFNILWALVTKSAEEVANGLKMYGFPYVGLPLNLKMNNGLEFKNRTVRELVNYWPRGCKIIHSRPHHPQIHGKIVQRNRKNHDFCDDESNWIGQRRKQKLV